MGTGLSTKVAARYENSGGLILCAPYLSIGRLLRKGTTDAVQPPWLEVYDVSEHIKDVRCKVCVVHGEKKIQWYQYHMERKCGNWLLRSVNLCG